MYSVVQSRPLSATADIEQPCRKDGSLPGGDVLSDSDVRFELEG